VTAREAEKLRRVRRSRDEGRISHAAAATIECHPTALAAPD